MNKVFEFIGTCVAKSTHIFDYIEKKTGVDVLDMMAERREREEKEKEEHPIKWAGKKIAKGAAKGIVGGSLH